jgi:GxxExxY protein
MVPESPQEMTMERKRHAANDEILTEINSRIQEVDRPAEKIIDIGTVIKQINRAAMEVSKELGSGFNETVYQNALMVELKKEKLDARSNVPIKVRYKGIPVGEYNAHIVVEDKIILDLTMVDELEKIHEIQIINCLKASGHKIGLLINFASEKLEIRRFSL